MRGTLQAIHLLAAKGLDASKPGSGTYVGEFSLEMVKDPVDMLLQAKIQSRENLDRIWKASE